MHPRLYVAALTPLTFSLLTACFGSAAASERNPASEHGVAVIVREATPTTRRTTVSASGTIEPRATAQLAFEVPGKIVNVAVDEGDRVAAGQLLAALDRTDYALSHQQALLVAKRASDEARRARALSAGNTISANDLEKAINAEAQADVAAAMAEKRLHDTHLVSPLSGVVARRAANRGETIPVGATVFTIVDLDTVRARVAVPESDIGAIAPGAPATLTVPSLGDTTFSGSVRLVGVAADKIARTFAVEISVANPRHRLKAGMVVEASIETPTARTQLTVPASAVVRDAEGATQVFVYTSDDRRVHARRITPGVVVADEVEIKNGLGRGELVVVGGQHQLRDGIAARLVAANTRGSVPGRLQ